MRRLTDRELTAAHDILTGTIGELVRLSVFDLALGRPPRGGKAVMSELCRLGWIKNGVFTELGRLLRDPLREYGFWVERGRLLPSEDCVPTLKRERFREKRVLELGCGGGCNLLSLVDIPSQLTGIEPMPVYLQMGRILCAMADLPNPEVVEASAEAIPLPANSYDVILCYSSHQYMDVDTAIREMARVLAPGGELIVVGYSLWPFVCNAAVRLAASPNLGRAKFNIIATINTMSYEVFGKRFFHNNSGTTATPIYPRRSYMLRQLQRQGLSFNSDDSYMVASGETVLVANKPW